MSDRGLTRIERGSDPDWAERGIAKQNTVAVCAKTFETQRTEDTEEDRQERLCHRILEALVRRRGRLRSTFLINLALHGRGRLCTRGSGRPLGLCGQRLPELNLISIRVIDPGKATVGFVHSLGVNLYSLLF